MKKIISLALVLVMVLCIFAGCDKPVDPTGGNNPTNGTQGGTNNELAGTYEITMWVSESAGVSDLFLQQIERFNKENTNGIKIVASVEGVSEADAGSQVLADVASAPDIYCFAQDQLARLVQAAALLAPGKGAQATIKENNDAGSVAASTVAGTIYAYPMTSDNGYYMYYDKSVVTNPEELEAIIADCEKSGKLFRYALENAWYTASFFFATGCHNTWFMDAEGNYTNVDDDFNSAAGLVAMKGMQKLAQSSCYDSNADIFTDAAVVITGIWNANAAAEHFGENLGVTDLPSFSVDGNSYHLGSFAGYKLMGVKPQNDAKKAAVLSLLAQYLTNEQCQLERYQLTQWGPSNKAAQTNEDVMKNESLAALRLQNENSVVQGQIHGAWWDIAKLLGADAKAATSDADLQNALKAYEDAIKAVLTMTDEQKNAWGVIGNICGTNWDTDFPMAKQDDGSYLSDVLELHAGEEFKVRQGAAWDVNYGAGGVAGGDNIKVEADGKYRVKLVLGDTVTVELISAE